VDTPRQTGAWQDPIVAEVRAARQALFAAAEQDVSGHPVVIRASDSGIAGPEDAA
jgi:hypothetical protein